jgi:DNA-binding MarR family transcriptional regulator
MAGGFTQIQNSFLDDTALSPEARSIGILYARFANRKGWAFPGVALLTKRSGYGRDKVKRARKELVDKGFISRWRDQRHQGHFGRVKYRITEKLRPPIRDKPTAREPV